MTDSASNQIDQSSSRFARRLQSNPRFMAYVLHAYCQQEGFEFGELAGELGIAPEMLVRLALCRRPPGDAPSFAEQVRTIADYTLTDDAQLANILRQVESLEKLAQIPVPLAAPEAESLAIEIPSGLLAAARDHEELDENRPAPPKDQSPADK
jgi:hypothetical protein